MRPSTDAILEPPTLDPAGFGYAGIVSVTDDQGRKDAADLGKPTPLARQFTPVGRSIRATEFIFRCSGSDVHDRQLRWWLHPHGSSRLLEVRGNRVELVWMVQPESVGDRIYAGIGMAAGSRYHRHGGPDEQGYDGWIAFYYRVRTAPPAEQSAGWSGVSGAAAGAPLANRPRQSVALRGDRRAVVALTGKSQRRS